LAESEEVMDAMNACWSRDGVRKGLANAAILARSETHYFLSSHAPFRRIYDDRAQVGLREDEVFDRLFHSGHRNVQAIMYGEPGCGKSHLIHWLKLRCEDEAADTGELADIRCVLVKRGNGSLKDALQQIIEQLGGELTQYLDDVRTALTNISSETNRHALANQLNLELGPKRQDRGLPLLPRDLKHLSACFVAPHFGDWLRRENGAINAVIRRLTESSDVYERENLPNFTPEDFRVPPSFQRNNPPVVLELIEQFHDSDELCDQASTICNAALRDAVRELTGLSGTVLQNVFNDIRRVLARNRQRLALFVEDVSVMDALDRELVVALEPQTREGLCDLIVVLGVTHTGMTRINQLPENQLQRITFLFSVARGLSEWGENEEELARFTARYLNTVRLPEEKVRAVAEQRRGGGDVAISACSTCEFESECHERFGFVELDGGARVGMFPLTHQAPRNLLQQLQEREDVGIRRTPRGLIMHLLHPMLENPDRLPQQFPPTTLPLHPPALAYWTAFEEQYCGGWPADEKKRLRTLAGGWITAQDPGEAAGKLEPLRVPLGFPRFTHRVEKPQIQEPVQRPEPKPPATEIPVVLSRLLANLEQWLSTGKLADDTKAREYLFDLVRTSIRWEDERGLPNGALKFLLAKMSLIEIEGQRSKARGAVIHFKRNQETADVIGALARFDHLGKKSWDFADGERYKRIVALWLRRHRTEITMELQPRGLDRDRPVAAAVEWLSVAATLGRRQRLPIDEPARLAGILFDDPWPQPPPMFSREGAQLIADMNDRFRSVREFLAQELDVPQGRTGGCVFIDPRPILRYSRDVSSTLTVRELPPDYHSDFWTSRYEAVKSLPATQNLWDREREALRDLLGAITTVLESDHADPQALRSYCDELAEIRAIQKKVFPLPMPAFDEFWSKRVYSQRAEVWANALQRAGQVLAESEPTSVAVFSPKDLTELKDALLAAEDYLDTLEREVARKLQVVTDEGDPDRLAAELSRNLEKIGTSDQEKLA